MSRGTQMGSVELAHEFYSSAMPELDKLILGEREAKLGMLVVMATGGNGVFVGEPGGGKTTLAEHSYRLIAGINDANVAKIPAQADLKPQQLVGGTSAVTRTTDGVKEEIASEINPLITPETQVIFADEINRGAPHAVNSLLGAFETRRFANTAGEVVLDNMEYAVATMNPGGVNEGVFKVNPANASRHSIGVVLGHNEQDKDNTIMQILGNWRPKPEDIEPVLELEELVAIRNLMANGVNMSEGLKSQTMEWIKGSTQHLRKEHNILQSDYRYAKQVADTAKAIATLYGEKSVDEENVKQAIKFVLGARIGMLTTQAEVKLPQAVEAVLGE